MKRCFYALEWWPYGAAQTSYGKTYTNVYIFPSRKDRDHWVRDCREPYSDKRGYRWAATRREAQRSLYWGWRAPYLRYCAICGRVFGDDCDLHEHAQMCLETLEEW